jgi:hypothetical protein
MHCFVRNTLGRGRGRAFLSSSRFIVPSSSFVASFELRLTVTFSFDSLTTPFCLMMEHTKDIAGHFSYYALAWLVVKAQ